MARIRDKANIKFVVKLRSYDVSRQFCYFRTSCTPRVGQQRIIIIIREFTCYENQMSSKITPEGNGNELFLDSIKFGDLKNFALSQ